MLVPLLQEVAAVTSTNLPPPTINHPVQHSDTPSEARNGSSNETPEPEEAAENDEANQGHDPYANLDGAFSNYLPDEPRPVHNVRQTDLDDDLLL